MSDQRTWIVSLDDRLFYGPMYARVIAAAGAKIHGVVVLPGPSLAVSELLYRFRFWGALASLHVARMLIAQRVGLATVAARAGIPVRRCARMAEALEVLRRAEATHALATVPVRLSRASLAALPGGWINTHCGKLPRYAGVDAPFWSMLHGEPELAVTLHYMAPEYDAGPIVAQRTMPNDRAPYLVQVDRLFKMASNLHVDALMAGLPKQSDLEPQNLAGRTYFSRPTIDDGKEFRRRGLRFI